MFVFTLFVVFVSQLSTAVYKPTLRLPDLLEYINGTKVTTSLQWQSRRKELKYLLDTYILGTKPDTFPSISSFQQINTTQYNYGISTYYSFHLDLKNSSAIIFELICPSKVATIKQPSFPVILSQYNHREWLLRAVQRSIFCGVRTPTSDTRDDSQQFAALYPNQTWGTIARRAWLDSIIITCLHQHVFPLQPYLNLKHIGIVGHSRNGKQSLIAAAYDERITSVVASSSGMPAASPFRYTSRDFFGETCTHYPAWWAPNFQLFYGKENECPADGHFITALIAPRYIMFANALNDNAADNSFANDHNYMASAQVYKLLNLNPHNYFTVQHREGTHHGFVRIESYLDFFSYAFGFIVSNEILYGIQHPLLFHNFTFEDWNKTYDECLNRTKPAQYEPLRTRISWLLGSDVFGNGGGYSCGTSYGEESDAEFNYMVHMMGETLPSIMASNDLHLVNMQSFSFGGYIGGDIYYPAGINPNVSLPVIIYLHPYSYACGFVPNYVYDTDPFYIHFASRGYIVVTYHQIGFGERIYEGKYFYDRFGCSQQSRFGHMVKDVRLLIDFIQCLAKIDGGEAKCSTGEMFTKPYKNLLNEIPFVDMSRLSVVGYAIGASVGLHATALDDRIANIASIAGFTPFRNNTNDLPNAGNYYYYDIHALIPKLGFFEDEEEMIPYDYNDIFEQISPRKTLIYSPIMDRNAYHAAVAQCVENSKIFWVNNNAAYNFTVIQPNDVSDWGLPQYKAILDWLNN